MLRRTLGNVKRMFGGTASPLAPLRLRPPMDSPSWTLRTFSVTAAAGRGGSGTARPAFFARPQAASSLASPAVTPRGSPPKPRNPAAPDGARPAGLGAPAAPRPGHPDAPSPDTYPSPEPYPSPAGWGGEAESPEPRAGARPARGAAGPPADARGSADGPLGLGMSQNEAPGAAGRGDGGVGAASGLGFGWSGTPEAFREPMRAGLANLPVTPVALAQGGGPPRRVPLSPKPGNVREAAPAAPPWKAEGGARARHAPGAAAAPRAHG